MNPADVPVLIPCAHSDTLPLRTIADYADTVVAQRLSQVTGVGLVSIEGGQKEAMRLQAKPAALAALGLSMEDLRTAIAAATVDLPKGSIDGSRLSWQIGADDQLISPASYRDLIVAYRDNAPVRLTDVATIVEGVENDRLGGWYDGKPAVIIDIQRQPGANTIAVADAIKTLLPKLRASIPPPSPSISCPTARSRSAPRSTMCNHPGADPGPRRDGDLRSLRRVWATVIPAVTLPVSLIATFGIMALAGFSLDNLSLMALTIASASWSTMRS